MLKKLFEHLWTPKALSLVLMTALLVTLWTTRAAGANPPSESLLQGDAPTMINYQGVVKVAGQPYDGTGYFKFTIVGVATGNGTSNYWSNDGTGSGQPAASVPLAVDEGLFNVLLGNTSLPGMTRALDETAFAHNPTYLRVWFSPTGAAGSFEALEPNQRISSVAYALYANYADTADTVDGYHASGTPTANTLIALDSSGYLRVPRMLDSNSTGYYVDPASTSVVRYLDVRENLFDGDSSQVTVDDGLTADYFGVNGYDAWAGYYVEDSASNDVDCGLHVASADTYGVYVGDVAGGDGVYVQNANGYGIYARGSTGGYFQDIDSTIYTRIAYGSYGIYSNGDIYGSSKSFVHQHPTDPSKVIVYTSLEGPEASTYYRGSAQLDHGTAVIELPEHFSLVTEEEELTVQVTPREDCKGLYVDEVTTTYIVVKEMQGGTSDARFDFFINGVRVGYTDYRVIRDASEFGPVDDASPAAAGGPHE